MSDEQLGEATPPESVTTSDLPTAKTLSTPPTTGPQADISSTKTATHGPGWTPLTDQFPYGADMQGKPLTKEDVQPTDAGGLARKLSAIEKGVVTDPDRQAKIAEENLRLMEEQIEEGKLSPSDPRYQEALLPKTGRVVAAEKQAGVFTADNPNPVATREVKTDSPKPLGVKLVGGDLVFVPTAGTKTTTEYPRLTASPTDPKERRTVITNKEAALRIDRRLGVGTAFFVQAGPTLDTRQYFQVVTSMENPAMADTPAEAGRIRENLEASLYVKRIQASEYDEAPIKAEFTTETVLEENPANKTILEQHGMGAQVASGKQAWAKKVPVVILKTPLSQNP